MIKSCRNHAGRSRFSHWMLQLFFHLKENDWARLKAASKGSLRSGIVAMTSAECYDPGNQRSLTHLKQEIAP